MTQGSSLQGKLANLKIGSLLPRRDASSNS